MPIRFSADEFKGLGLELAGYKRWHQYEEKRQIERFKAFYGLHPKSCEQIWIDLQTTTNDEYRIDGNANPRDLLLGIYFLWEYPTERKFNPIFHLCEETVRNKCKIWTKKIQSLLPDMVSAFDDELHYKH